MVWQSEREGDLSIYVSSTPVAGISEKRKRRELNISVYPNPFIKYCEVRHFSSLSNLRICDLSGRVVEVPKNKMIGRELPSGIYFLVANKCKPIKVVKIKN
jgi:hypothetical protein